MHSLSLQGTPPDYLGIIKRIIRQQFHRPGNSVFCLDEFGLMGQEGAEGVELIASGADVFRQPSRETPA
ncbi:hypothetical protein D9M68_813550 [compost metagenome]